MTYYDSFQDFWDKEGLEVISVKSEHNKKIIIVKLNKPLKLKGILTLARNAKKFEKKIYESKRKTKKTAKKRA